MRLSLEYLIQIYSQIFYLKISRKTFKPRFLSENTSILRTPIFFYMTFKKKARKHFSLFSVCSTSLSSSETERKLIGAIRSKPSGKIGVTTILPVGLLRLAPITCPRVPRMLRCSTLFKIQITLTITITFKFHRVCISRRFKS